MLTFALWTALVCVFVVSPGCILMLIVIHWRHRPVANEKRILAGLLPRQVPYKLREVLLLISIYAAVSGGFIFISIAVQH